MTSNPNPSKPGASTNVLRDFRHAKLSTRALVVIAASGVIGVTVALTPGISVGAFSKPVGLFSNPVVLLPASTTTTTRATNVSTTTTLGTTASTTTITIAPSTAVPPTTVPSTTTLSTTTVPATTTSIASKVTIVGTARQGAAITVQAGGFKPKETVTITINGRKYLVRASAAGVASLRFTVPKNISSLKVSVKSASTPTRTTSVAVTR